MFKRKAYLKMFKWKNTFNGTRSCLLEGPRRIGKTTLAENFAKNEYKTCIIIDFANVSKQILSFFEDISNLDLFFLKLQHETGVTLYTRESAIVFDEIQLFPQARQAIKYLVKDGRYDYIETGSLISIQQNVKDILIPSEEYKIQVFPMDYEEFLWATGGNVDLIRELVRKPKPIGNTTNTLMRNFRIYMAVGGMPQAVEAYVNGKNFSQIDEIKRDIIKLYTDDLRKLDKSGRLSDIFASVPSQLALKRNRFVLTAATNKQKTFKDEERLFELIDSKTVLPCYKVSDPSVLLAQSRDPQFFKLYVADTGLFTTMIFNNKAYGDENVYKKLLSNKLDANLGYLYENVIAQVLAASETDLFFYTWAKENSTHSYEVDFLLAHKKKLIPIEVKSSAARNHRSLQEFSKKFSHLVGEQYLFSQNDFGTFNEIKLLPIYAMPFFIEQF